MSAFTITEVLGTDEFSTENGSFVSYTVKFTGEQGAGTAQHTRKSASPAPTVGEVLDAELTTKNGKPQLKRIWKDKPPSGGGGRSPQDTKQIVRQHSQHMAMLHVASMERRGKLPEDWNLEALKKVIQWYQNDAEGVA
jgi:hypothetical protein